MRHAVLLMVAGVLGGAALSRAADGPPPPAESPLRFRRVYAPADRLKDWPRDNLRYVPVDAEEFERLAASAQARAAQAALPTCPLAEADYRARLEGDTLVDGEAVLRFTPFLRGGGRWTLEPWNLAVSEALWAATPPRPAPLVAAGDGKLAVLSDPSGELRLTWSLRGWRDPSGIREFEFNLPPCPLARLVLDLPKDVQPVAESGVTTRQDSALPDRVRWSIEPGPRPQFRLRVVPLGQLGAGRSLDTVRQATLYEMSLRGLDVTSQWTLDIRSLPRRQIAVELDPGLRLSGAWLGELPLRWSVAGASSAGQPSRAWLELPEPIRGPNRVLRLSAMGPVVLDRPWRLPEIRPQDFFWQEGTLRLLVPAPLSLEHLSAEAARQTGTGLLAAPRAGESAELQCFGPSAGVQVVLGTTQPEPLWNCGTMVELGGVELRARVVAQLQVQEGEQFQVTAEVGRRWTIQAVESLPPDALDDWSQDATAGGRLTVRLARAILPRRPLELRITAHCLAGPKTDAWTTEALIPLRFLGQAGRHLLGLRAQEGYQLHVSGAERWTQLDSAPPAGPERDLLPDPWPPFVFRYDPRLAAFRAHVQKPKPSYTATIRVEALVEPGRLTETYHLRCLPESASLDRVLVRIVPARSVPLRWSMVGGESESLSARTLPEASPANPPSETWEVSLRRPQTGPFELRGVRSVPFQGPLPISLATLPEAKSQRGTIVIGASGGAAAGIENHRLLPVPLDAVPVDRAPVWRASFHFDPVSEGRANSAAGVVHPAEPGELLPGAWVWDLHLESRYAATGLAHHVAQFRLENTGRQQFALTLPPGLAPEAISSAWVDGVRTPWALAGDASPGTPQIRLPLPPARRYPVVAVHYVTPVSALGPWAHLRPPLLVPDVPVLRRAWTLWVPPGYQALDASRTAWPGGNWGLAERLAGPLAQISGASASARAWWQALLGTSTAPAAEEIEEFLGRLAKTEESLRKRAQATGGEGKPPATVTWGQLLAQMVEDTRFHLVVDEPALSGSGVVPQTPVSSPAGASMVARGRALLGQADLMLVVTSDTLLLTRRSQAAVHRASLSERDATWATASGALARQIQEAWSFPASEGFLPVHLWSRLPPSPANPWPPFSSAGEGPTDAMGWSAGKWEVPEDGLGVWVVDEDAVETARWAALVILLAMVGWGFAGRLGLRVLVVGVVAIAALAVPDPFVPPCSGAFLGAVAGVIVWLFRRGAGASKPAPKAGGTESPAPARPSAGSSSARRAAQTGLTVVVLAWGVGFEARSQEPSTPVPEAPRPPVYQVIIPTEADQKLPSKYLIPEAFYAELQRRAEGPPERLPLWTLAGAVYRGIAAWKDAPEQLAVLDLRAYYDLEVVGRNVRLVLPLGSELVQPLSGGVLLDGRPAMVRSLGEAGLEVEIAEPGRYRLEVPLHVTVQSAGGWSGFETRIPPLATARLEWTLPRDASAIEVPWALGRVSLAPEGGRLVAELGPTPRLATRWPEGLGRSPGGPLMDVEQLLWLKIQPGSVVLDVTLRCRMLQGRGRWMELLADPRLRLAPIEGDRSWLAQVETIPGSPQSIRFALADRVPDQFDASVSFLVTDTSGVGQVRLPWVSVSGARTVRRWLAVSVDPSLQYQQSGAEGLQPVGVPTFLAAWGPAKAEPLFVYDLPGGEPAWSLSTRPVPPRTSVEQTLSIVVGRGRGELVLDAQLVTQPGPRFQYRLRVPRAVELDRVVLVEQSAEQPLRFARSSAQDEVTVFLSGPAAGKSHLRAQGHFAVPPSGTVDVPLLCALAEETKSLSLQVFREPQVRLEAGAVEGLVPFEAPAVDAGRLPSGRWVGCWRSDGSSAPRLQLQIAPNEPRVRGEQITLLDSAGEGWSADTEFRLEVQGGLADEFRLEVPAEWPGPYKIEPPMAVKPGDAPAKGRRQLVLRPATAVEGKFRFRVSGPLGGDPGTAPSVPRVTLHQAEIVRHRLILPVQSALQSLFWETQGLAPAPLPEDFVLPAKPRDSYAAFQVVHEPFRTILRSLGQISGVSQVLLADVLVAARADGTCRGVALFDVQPAGLAGCPLELPEGVRLVQVAVEGIPVLPVAQGPHQFSIPLGLNLMPQRIEIVFEGRWSGAATEGPPRCPIPRLGDLPVQTTLWTVVGLAPLALLSTDAGQLDGLQQELLRAKHLTALAELGANLPEDDAAVAARWFLPWARRWRAALDQVGRLLALGAESEDAQAVRAELQSLRARQTRAAERLHAAEVLNQVLWETPVAAEAAALWAGTFGPGPHVAQGAVEGPLSAVLLPVSPRPTPPVPGPLLAVLVAAALTAGLSLAASRPAVANAVQRWPTLVLAATGVAWWLWLWPPVVGGLATLAGLVGTVWLAWKGWRPRRPPP